MGEVRENGARHALLIATGGHESPAFETLRSPARDVECLAEVLGDPALGGFEVETLLDRGHSAIKMKLEDLSGRTEPDDLLLVYLSGHGFRDHHGKVHFAAADSKATNRAATMISARFVNQMMSESAAGRRVLILNTRFSGAFVATDELSLLHEVTGNGYAVLTATDDFAYALDAPSDANGRAGMTPFARAIVEAIATGSASHDGRSVTLDDLRPGIRRTRLPKQSPKFFTSREQGEIPIARVPAAPISAPEIVRDEPEPPPAAREARWARRLREESTDVRGIGLAFGLGAVGAAYGAAAAWPAGDSVALGAVTFALVYGVRLGSALLQPHSRPESGDL